MRLFETSIANVVLFPLVKVASPSPSPSVNAEYIRHHFCHPQSSHEELLSVVWNFYYSYNLFVHACLYASWSALLTIWVPGIDLKWSCLVADTFIPWPCLFFFKILNWGWRDESAIRSTGFPCRESVQFPAPPQWLLIAPNSNPMISEAFLNLLTFWQVCTECTDIHTGKRLTYIKQSMDVCKLVIVFLGLILLYV